MMNAAVVTSFAEPPHYLQAEVPRPRTEDEMLVDVLAVGLHPRVRTGAAGSALHQHRHIADDPRHRRGRAAARRPPGLLRGGRRRGRHDGGQGARRRAPLNRAARRCRCRQVAAAMNPAMSSWVALRHRVPIGPGTEASWFSARPATPERWPYRWPGGSALDALSAPDAIPAGYARSPRPAPTTSSSSPTTADATGRALAAAAAELRHRARLLLGDARATGDRRAPHCADRPQPRDELDPDRLGRRPDDRAAVSGPALGQLPPSGQRPGRRLSGGLPRPAARTRRGDQRGTIAVRANTMPLAEWSRSGPGRSMPGERIVLVP